MARLEERLDVAGKALAGLHESVVINNPTTIDRDAAIQRYKVGFEAVWKAAKLYLSVHEGLEAASPKSAIRLSREVGLLTDAEAMQALIMADDRNLTVHTYNEALAQQIHSRLKDYHGLLTKWLAAMKK